MQTVLQAAAELGAGRTTSRALVEHALARIADPAGEGGRAFLKVYADQARAQADAVDALRRVGRAPGPYAGLPVSLKDLLDVAGEPTPAGSTVLADAPPAPRHAAVVRRLLAAGFVPVGRTNMTEFAFSGLGVNPHFGTPLAPWRREEGRIAGGSSSGAAVSVSDGMAVGAVGTDTGGSCRIPAAFCGVVGYKPTARRVPLDGVLPLSPSLDSVGPLGRSVSCCAILDAVFAGEEPAPPPPLPLAGLRLAVPTNVVLDGLDTAVADAFERALSRLGAAGARITRRAFTPIERIVQASAAGGFAAAEAYAWHRPLLADRAAGYDPRVRVRIERGATLSAADYVDLRAARAAICASMDAATAPFDALALPTAPILPPRLADLRDDPEYARVNTLALRNPAPFNFLDRCSLSLPAHRPGEPPVGLMLVGETGGDRRLFALALAVEAALKE